MALRRGHDQQSGQEVIAFVNTKPDDLAQLATRYDANQITFLRRLVRNGRHHYEKKSLTSFWV
jgi:hypothetical protein